jgi:hypothetical protein
MGFSSSRHAYPDANSYGYRNSHSHSHCNAYVDPNANADTYCIADG